MKHRFVFRLAPALVLALLAPGAVQGQPAYAQPRVSPYLNLLRGGATPGMNYYNLVRPEVDFRSSIYQLQQQNVASQAAITALQQGPPGVLTTGHPVGFLTHNAYFLNVGAPGQVGFGTITGQRPGTGPGAQGTGRPASRGGRR